MAGELNQVTAQFFPDGIDSNTNPEYLQDTQWFNAMNCVFRGGMPQTRPGFWTVFGMPCGKAQGFTMFKPTGAPPYMVAAIAGKVYASRFPFDSYVRLGGIQFDEHSPFVVFQDTVQTTTYDFDGGLEVLQRPKNVLIMQDGCSRAAAWDGGQAVHIDPTPSNQEFTKEGFDGTVIGTWMAWAGNRLWVGRKNEVFASDYGNPLKFTETQYIAEGRSFSMPEEITGMGVPSQAADRSPLIVFGSTTNTQLRADIQDRSQWLDTPNFQVQNNNIGCISGKSIVRSHGQLWWYSLSGWVNYNNTLQTLNDSSFRYMDNEMGVSKRNISPNTNIITGASFENYLLVSVPSGDIKNRHTWVYDQQTNSSGRPSWNGYWTGIRPVQWWSGNVDGAERIFCLSEDYDGVNRVWEAFHPSRTDNGCDITCFAETKQHNFGGSGYKIAKYTKIHLDEVYGDLDFAAYVGGKKGGYRKVLDKRMIATTGPFDTDRQYCGDTDQYQSYVPQTRIIKTRSDDRISDDCNQCGVESQIPNHIDTSFGNLFLWSGRCAVRMYQMFAHDADAENEDYQGKCEQNETGTKILTMQGCGSITNDTDLGCAFEAYTESATDMVTCLNTQDGDDSLGVGIGTSYISELDATKKAECNALLDALSTSTCSVDLDC